MASHQPGVVCESDQPGPGPWAQIKDSLPNARGNKEKRKTKQQHQQNNIKKTETTTSVIRQKKGM